MANTTALFAKTRETLLQAQDCLGPVLGRRITTFTLSRSRFLGFAAAGAFVALSASLPARAEDLAQNLGPVGPHEPILTSVGSKRVIAFYEPGGGHCSINVVVWDRADESGDSAGRVRVSLNPRQTVHIDSVESKSINLQCGDYAETLALVDTSKFVSAGASE